MEVGFAQWLNLSIIYGDTCSLIHEESYHGGIKYHMTLNIIFSVVHEPSKLVHNLGGFTGKKFRNHVR